MIASSIRAAPFTSVCQHVKDDQFVKITEPIVTLKRTFIVQVYNPEGFNEIS